MATSIPRSMPPDVISGSGASRIFLALIALLASLAVLVGGFFLLRDPFKRNRTHRSRLSSQRPWPFCGA